MMTTLRGIPFEVHENEDLSNAIRRDQDFFEAEILDYLKVHHNQQNVILDIGANIGNHSVFFSEFLESRLIVAFEPMQENYELLEKNLAPYVRSVPVQVALSDEDGTVSMFLARDNYGASAVNQDGDRQVPCFKLDRMLYDNVTLMKIDVEEYEPAVLAGARETIQRCQPLILMEDWFGTNKDHLPSNYQLIQGWDHHHTFLYGPKND